MFNNIVITLFIVVISIDMVLDNVIMVLKINYWLPREIWRYMFCVVSEAVYCAHM